MQPNDPNTAFSQFVAPEPSLNATIAQARLVCLLYSQAGFTNPRIFANPVGFRMGEGMVPETSWSNDGDNSMIDTSQTLRSLNIPGIDRAPGLDPTPGDPALYLAFTLDETNRTFAGVSTFFPVAACIKELKNPNTIAGLMGLMSLFAPGANVDAKVLQIIGNMPGALAAIRAGLNTPAA